TSSSVSVEDSQPTVTSTSEVEPSSEEPQVTSVEDTEAPPSIPTSEAPVFEHKTIEEIRAMTEDGASATADQKQLFYETSGVVTAKFRGANIDGVGPAWNIAIQDGEHALLLYAVTEEAYAADFADVPIGSKLTVTGNLAAYNGLRELSTIKYVSHEAASPVEPEVLASIEQADLAGKDSKLVKIEGLKLHAKPQLEAYVDGDGNRITVNMDLRKDGVKIGTYMHYNIPLADAQATVEKLQTVTSNSTVTWTGILGMHNKVFQLTNANADEWEIEVGAPVVLETIAFRDETKELAPGATYQTTLVSTPFDAVVGEVTYASDAAAVATVDAEGVVTAVAVGTANITATASGKVATMVITVADAAEGVYDITVVDSYTTTSEIKTEEAFLAAVEGYPVGMTVPELVKVFGIAPTMASSNHNDYTATTGFKFSTGDANAALTLKMPAGVEIAKVKVEGRAWGTDTATLAINEGEAQTFMVRDADPNLLETREFVLATPSETLSFVFTKRVIASKITLEVAGAVTPPEEIEGTIAHFLAQPLDYVGTLEAVITNLGPYNSFGMEDATGAVAFRKSGIDAVNAPFAVGDKVSGSFKKVDYNGLMQAELQDAAPTVEAGPHALTLPRVNLNEVGLTAEALGPYQSRLVTGELTVKTIAAKDGKGNITLLLTDGTNDITLRLDSRLPKFAEFEFLMDLVVGDSVVLKGAVIGWFNGPQLAADDAAQLEVIRQMSIEAFLALEIGALGKLSGVITNMGPHNSFGMEDATAAVAFRKYNIDSTTTLFAVGDKVSGTFKKADFNGLIQAELQEDAPTVEAGPHALTLEKVDLGVVGLTAEALAPYQSRLVTGELTVKTIAAKDGKGNITLLLTDGTNDITLRLDYRLAKIAEFEFLMDLVVGDVVVLDGAIIGWYNGPQLAADDPVQVVKKV
ncbi:MAG: Ig-like domain-containing protein, partial [Bacillota bacterium]|nr:Ig-like domain-containing protein [Bacillota bacterium]